MFNQMRWWLPCCWMATTVWIPLAAAPLRVLPIGDSLTEEYTFEVPFSAPDSNPLNANVENWPEILAARRAAGFSMGAYQSSLFSYPDLRNGGYKTNYGVPSFRTWDWVDVCQSDWTDTFSGDPIISLWYPTRLALDRHLGEVDAVVIFLGGNDLKSDYHGIFNNPAPPALLANVVSNVAWLHDYVRSREPGLPIIIATVPDVGATPEVAENYTDPAKQVVARARIAAMNASLIAMATARGATVARIDTLTDRIFDQVPLHLNGTDFNFGPHPENPPLHVFCKDGFHPAAMAQALIADQIVDALNRATGSQIPRLGNREILASVLGLDPDQPYLDWAGTVGGMFQNPDGDGLPNLTEFVLGTPPLVANSPFAFGIGGLMGFTPSVSAMKFAAITVEESDSLSAWQPVPPKRIETAADGTWWVFPSGGEHVFYRLAVAPRP
ncbi:MAG: GDSL-type esterase/lipase family protein [Luteolibacter sp.]|jgi:lysophospholipase L1-like esterase|nr:GDSL-type esterase/lipase family protein [Luteolibacter sp.]